MSLAEGNSAKRKASLNSPGKQMSSFAATSMSLPLSECVPVSSKVREGTDCPPSLSTCSSEAGSTLNHRLEFSSPGWKPACPSDPPVSPTPWSYMHWTPPPPSLSHGVLIQASGRRLYSKPSYPLSYLSGDTTSFLCSWDYL